MIIELKKVSKAYGAVSVVDEVSIRISKGERVGIIGHTGCGKTTLARTQTRMIFQDPEAVFNPGLRIKNLFYEALMVTRKWDRQQTRENCLKHFASLGLPVRVWNSLPTLLSYGQKARLNVLRSVLTDPNILIADEPFVGMDVTTKKKVKQFIVDHIIRKQKGLVMITHDYSTLEELIDRVYVMDMGKIVDSLPVAKLFGGKDLSSHAANLMESQLLFRGLSGPA
jgi:peptide/nickel transport system ATP-binding protein